MQFNFCVPFVSFYDKTVRFDNFVITIKISFKMACDSFSCLFANR